MLSAVKRRSMPAWLVPVVVVAIGGAYVRWHLGRGWIPFDDGALGHSAERVLRGELPQRDFDDIYTGGLALLNAAAFELLGTTLWAMRSMLFAAFLVWVPAVYYLASRFVRPAAAGALTLLAVVWSVPNYPAAMPSWYNLFLATFGTTALMRYVEDRRARWLLLAGIAGGLSFLMKVVGVYYIAAGLLFLVFQEHEEARASEPRSSRRWSGYVLFVCASLLVFVLAISMLIAKRWHGGEVVHFVLPSAAIAALLMWSEWSMPAGASRRRFRGLLQALGPFVLGVSIPVAIFLAPYATSGALGVFARGVFILPTKRFAFATAPMLSPATMVAVLPSAALLLVARRAGGIPRWALAAVVVVLVWVLRITAVNGASYRFVWDSARNLMPVLVLSGVGVLWRPRPGDAEDPLRRRRTFLILAVTALCSLIQFPYAEPNYFCYVAPLVALSVTALWPYARPMQPAVPAIALGFYLAFAVMRANTTTLFTMGYRFVPYGPTVPLRLDRADGVTVAPEQAQEYETLIPIVKAHARSDYVWASPDCPEVYFLAGVANPTRSLFEFFDTAEGRDARVLRDLDSHGVNEVVLNRAPGFSPWLSSGLLHELYVRYPHVANVGRFHVRWRS